MIESGFKPSLTPEPVLLPTKVWCLLEPSVLVLLISLNPFSLGNFDSYQRDVELILLYLGFSNALRWAEAGDLARSLARSQSLFISARILFLPGRGIEFHQIRSFFCLCNSDPRNTQMGIHRAASTVYKHPLWCETELGLRAGPTPC